MIWSISQGTFSSNRTHLDLRRLLQADFPRPTKLPVPCQNFSVGFGNRLGQPIRHESDPERVFQLIDVFRFMIAGLADFQRQDKVGPLIAQLVCSCYKGELGL